jgi:hypothetical protein
MKINNLKYIKLNKELLPRGFSIIEIIIYLAIFGALSIFIINSFIVSISSFNNISINHSLAEAGVSSVDRVSREIRQAISVDIFNSTSEVLQLNSLDDSGNPIVVKIIKEGDLLNLYKNNILVGNILDEDVIVQNLNFRRIDTTYGEAIKFEISVFANRGKQNKTANFYNSIVLRGSY